MKENVKKVSELDLEKVNGGVNMDGYTADSGVNMDDYTADFEITLIIDRCPHCNEDFTYSTETAPYVYDPKSPSTCPKCGKLIIF